MTHISQPSKKILRSYFIRILLISLLWCLLIVPSVGIDYTYRAGKTNCFSSIVAFFIAQGHKRHITYANLYNMLDGYSSILITVVGIIVTGWINLSDRLEQTVYGIRRKDLFAATLLGKFIVNSFIGIFTTPIWMIYALIHQYCFTAYFIMVLILIQFSVSNLLLALSYNRQYDYQKLYQKLSRSLKSIRQMSEFEQYDELLDKIALSIDQKTDWEPLKALFFDLVYSSNEEEPIKFYRIMHSFTAKIFASKSKKEMISLFTLYTQKMPLIPISENNAKLIYWILTDCMYQYCSEKQINSYLDHLFDILALTHEGTNTSYDFTQKDIEDIFSILALHTEHWLQENDSSLKCFGEKMNSIYRFGTEIYISRRAWMLLDYIEYHNLIVHQYSDSLYQCFERLKNSCLSKNKHPYADTLLQNIGQLHQR